MLSNVSFISIGEQDRDSWSYSEYSFWLNNHRYAMTTSNSELRPRVKAEGFFFVVIWVVLKGKVRSAV